MSQKTTDEDNNENLTKEVWVIHEDMEDIFE